MELAGLPFAVQPFDLAAREVSAGRCLPHWSQPGAVCFVTWRTADSLPLETLKRLEAERVAWRSANPQSPPVEYRRASQRGYETALDRGIGACPLRDPACAAIVADALRHFDGERYVLLDFVVMPNHVHVLAAFADGDAMRRQCESWKKFTAGVLNRRLGRSGRFWQSESFDHIVRSDDQFSRIRRYIADNPTRAGLADGEFLHYSATLPESIS